MRPAYFGLSVSRIVGLLGGLGSLASGIAVVTQALGPRWTVVTTVCGLVSMFCERATGNPQWRKLHPPRDRRLK